jgi:hypothetical protein
LSRRANVATDMRASALSKAIMLLSSSSMQPVVLFRHYADQMSQIYSFVR